MKFECMALRIGFRRICLFRRIRKFFLVIDVITTHDSVVIITLCNIDEVIGIWNSNATQLRPGSFGSFQPISGPHLYLHEIQPITAVVFFISESYFSNYHLIPWTTESRTEESRALSTSEGRVSSRRMLGPFWEGPKAQIERAANRSQSYFSLQYHLLKICLFKEALNLKKLPIDFLSIWMCTLFVSISSARPFSIGSQIIVSLFFLLGVSAKHLSWEWFWTCLKIVCIKG